MPIKIMDAGGVLRTISSMKVQDGGTLRPIRTAKILDGATLRTVAEFVPALTVSITPTLVFAYGEVSTLTTNAATATPVGGASPFTYAWTITYSTATINSPTLATTTFTLSGLAPGAVEVAAAEVTVTDSIGQTAQASINFTFTRPLPDGGGITP